MGTVEERIPKDLIPLIDGDWLIYLACNAVEYPLMKEWKEEVQRCMDEERPIPPEPDPSFEETVDVFEHKIKDIIDELQTTAAPVICLSGANNFRKALAKTKGYKENRIQERPFHYENLTTYIETKYHIKQEDYLEADDIMAIVQTSSPDSTCIVTVDKDLRQVNGWHYSPEIHNAPKFGPAYVTDKNSYIEVREDTGKVVGTGWKFFYYQLLVGDPVDNIPGLPGCGPKAAYPMLVNTTTEGEAFEVVRDAYRSRCLIAEEHMLEQARLLWMIRKVIDGKPVMWEMPDVVG